MSTAHNILGSDAKPRGGNIISTRKDTLANQMPEEVRKTHNSNGAVKGKPYVWTDN